MPHHLVSEVHQKTFCIYCKKDVPLDRWESDFHSGMHYKTTKCSSCGRKLHIKVDFGGSGHDSWNGSRFKSKITKKGVKTIEDKLKVLERHFPKK